MGEEIPVYVESLSFGRTSAVTVHDVVRGGGWGEKATEGLIQGSRILL